MGSTDNVVKNQYINPVHVFCQPSIVQSVAECKIVIVTRLDGHPFITHSILYEHVHDKLKKYTITNCQQLLRWVVVWRMSPMNECPTMDHCSPE